MHKCRPSTLLDVTDPYTSYCFDEACAYILRQIENGNEPIFRREYKSFKELYADYER